MTTGRRTKVREERVRVGMGPPRRQRRPLKALRVARAVPG